MSLHLLYMNSEGSCYQSLQNIPVKEEVNPSGSSTQAVHNSNMMDTVEKSKLPEESRYGPIGFSHFFKIFLPINTVICFNMKQDSQPTDRSCRQHLHTLEFSYHLLPAFSSPLSSIFLSLLPFPTCDMMGGSTFFCLSPCFCIKRRQDCRWEVISVCTRTEVCEEGSVISIISILFSRVILHWARIATSGSSTLTTVGFLNCVFFSGFPEVGSR